MSNKPRAENPCRERRADVFALQSESATRCGADDRQRCGRRRLVEQQLSAFRLWTDSTFPSATTPKELVKIAKHRCIIGRDYERPGWRGLHHHATLCIAAYGFLVTERSHSPYIYTRRSTGATRPGISARLPSPRLAARTVIILTPSQPCTSRSPEISQRLPCCPKALLNYL